MWVGLSLEAGWKLPVILEFGQKIHETQNFCGYKLHSKHFEALHFKKLVLFVYHVKLFKKQFFGFQAYGILIFKVTGIR